MNSNKFQDGDLLVIVMNIFLKLLGFMILAFFTLPLFYMVGEFAASLVNIAFFLLGVNAQMNWLSIWAIVLIFVTVFYWVTGRYKTVYFRSWSSEDRDGIYQDFEIRL